MPLVPAMYSVEITVEKDKVTGETRVLSSTTSLPRELLPRGIKVYEDETKGTRPPARHTPGLTPTSLAPVHSGRELHRPLPTAAWLDPQPRPAVAPGTGLKSWPSARCRAGLRELNPGWDSLPESPAL